ncbi:MAG: hypothetical protein SX243_17385 [Acidobacteriota bacterium]|nr:hypothetical protein [Acidobacteriota bacterium]
MSACGAGGEAMSREGGSQPADKEAAKAGPPLTDVFFQRLAKKVDFAAAQDQTVVSGEDGWLFFLPELRSLAAGPFWGAAAAGVSQATREEDADPLPAILDFRDQLEARGIQLVVMPVPAKASLYPDLLFGDLEISTAAGLGPYGGAHAEFLGLLRSEGVSVVDLYPLFAARRFDGGGQLYCRTDTHWSGRAARLAAEAVVARALEEGWISQGSRQYRTERRSVEVQGDLWRELPEPRPAAEQLELTFVGTGDDLEPVPTDRSSPVLLLGDSHTLVFHAGGDLFARGAGLVDHLAAQLQRPVDLVGVRGSGATAARVNLLRRDNGLEGKKLVIWTFSARAFTESPGWQKVPFGEGS